MGENTNISWAHHTFNPWLGCSRVSAGCAKCYAERFVGGRMGLRLWGDTADRRQTKTWRNPVRWNRLAQEAGERHRVFCGSLCDVFEDHPTVNRIRPDLWPLIACTPHLDWLLLTKRPENISRMLPADWGDDGLPNVWLGTSIENRDVAHRSPTLTRIPAAIHFLSYEPALGPLHQVRGLLDGIDWLVCGGESGPGFRPMYVGWAYDIRDRCRDENVAFFFKQESAIKPGYVSRLGQMSGLAVREMPTLREKETVG